MGAIEKYGCQWPEDSDPVEIERYCVRAGGRWTDENGGECGAGLFTHYRNLEFLIWPEDYHNRWTDWMLRILIEERISVFGSCKDSGKTRRVSKFGLVDYWCFPEETLILMTSTTTRGLELRVWGDIKSLWSRGKERWPQLEGNPVD